MRSGKRLKISSDDKRKTRVVLFLNKKRTNDSTKIHIHWHLAKKCMYFFCRHEFITDFFEAHNLLFLRILRILFCLLFRDRTK